MGARRRRPCAAARITATICSTVGDAAPNRRARAMLSCSSEGGPVQLCVRHADEPEDHLGDADRLGVGSAVVGAAAASRYSSSVTPPTASTRSGAPRDPTRRGDMGRDALDYRGQQLAPMGLAGTSAIPPAHMTGNGSPGTAVGDQHGGGDASPAPLIDHMSWGRWGARHVARLALSERRTRVTHGRHSEAGSSGAQRTSRAPHDAATGHRRATRPMATRRCVPAPVARRPQCGCL
jgi:hypothetical protein